MPRKVALVGVLLLVSAFSLAGCFASRRLRPVESAGPTGVDSVASAIANAGDVAVGPPAIQEVEAEVYGRIGNLSAFFCPCFELSSEGETVLVRHGLFAEDGYEEVSVTGLENGDWVVVRGVLRLSRSLPPEMWTTGAITPVD